MTVRLIAAKEMLPERHEPRLHPEDVRRFKPASRRIIKDEPVNAEWAEYQRSHRDYETHINYLTVRHNEADNRVVRRPPRTAEEIERVRRIEQSNMAVRQITTSAMRPPKTTGGLVANLTDINEAWSLVKQNKVTMSAPVEVELEPATVDYLKKMNPKIKPVNAAVNLFRRRFKDEGLPYRAFANSGEKHIFTIVREPSAPPQKAKK